MACGGLRPAVLSLAGAAAAALLVLLHGSSSSRAETTTGAAGAAAAARFGGKRSREEGGADRGRRAHGGKLDTTIGGAEAREDASGSSRKLDVSIGFSEGSGSSPLVEGDDGLLFDEPPVLRNPIKDEWVQRCSNFNNATAFTHGSVCGPPLAEPCFDHSRCGSVTSRPKIYVYDQEVSGDEEGRKYEKLLQAELRACLLQREALLLCASHAKACVYSLSCVAR